MAKLYHVDEQSFLSQKMWKKWTDCWLLINMLHDDIQLEKENNFPGSGST